jgi:hypothetical protein
VGKFDCRIEWWCEAYFRLCCTYLGHPSLGSNCHVCCHKTSRTVKNNWYINRPGNPFYTAEELAHQIKLTKASLIIAHPVCQDTVFKVVKANVIPESRVVILQDPIFDHIPTLNSLISFGEGSKEPFEERRLSKGEARNALAFLSLSSGTTGTFIFFCPLYTPSLTALWKDHLR